MWYGLFFLTMFTLWIIALSEEKKTLSKLVKSISVFMRGLSLFEKAAVILIFCIFCRAGGEKPSAPVYPRITVSPSIAEASAAANVELQCVTEARWRVATSQADYDDYCIARWGTPGPVTAEQIYEARKLLLTRMLEKLEAQP